MELVGNDAGVREVRLSKVLEWIAKVDDDVFYVFSAFDMAELAKKICSGFALGEFEDALVWIVDDDGSELGASLEAPEAVLIDSDGRRPRILALPELEFQTIVERFEDVTSGHAIRALDTGQVDKIFASPEHGSFESLSGSLAFGDAWNGLGKGSLTRLAPKAAFSDLKKDHLPSDGRIFESHGSMVIDRGARSCAFGADLEGGVFLNQEAEQLKNDLLLERQRRRVCEIAAPALPYRDSFFPPSRWSSSNSPRK